MYVNVWASCTQRPIIAFLHTIIFSSVIFDLVFYKYDSLTAHTKSKNIALGTVQLSKIVKFVFFLSFDSWTLKINCLNKLKIPLAFECL